MTPFTRAGLRALGALMLGALVILSSPQSQLLLAQSSSTAIRISARQNGSNWEIIPLTDDRSPGEVYDYDDFQSFLPLMEHDSSLIFLYQRVSDGTPGPLSLFIVHGPSSDSITQQQVNFTLSGLPNGAYLEIEDDPDDYYWLQPPSAVFRWTWQNGFTDGAVISGLTGEFSIAILPEFSTTTEKWLLLSGNLNDPDVIELQNGALPLTFDVRAPDPVAVFSISPERVITGGSIQFDASRSRSTTGSITQYRWDFDGDGMFETRADGPMTSRTFTEIGDIRVGLQITDSLARQAESFLTINVQGEPINARRALMTPLPFYQIMPQTEFTVQLSIETAMDVSGLGVKESPPSGWEIVPVDSDGAQFNRATNEWVFFEPLRPKEQRKIIYRVRVPDWASGGMHRFAGSAVSGLPLSSVDVSGETEVRVISSLPIELAITRLTENWEIDLMRPNFISFAQIQQALSLWLEQVPVPGTNGRKIDLQTMVRLIAYWLTDTPVTEPLPD